jgi:hypothetical protein
MPSDTIRTELEKLPWITETSAEKSTPNRIPVSGPEGHLASEPVKKGDGQEIEKYLNSPLKRRVAAALDTIRHELEMVDATGLEPVTPCV